MMKRFKQNLTLFFLLMMVMSSCKKAQLLTYNTADNVFFNYYQNVGPLKEQLGTPSQAAEYTFAYSNADIKTYMLPIPVGVTGAPSNVDREFNVTVDAASTATSQHFQLPESFKIRAGRVVDTFFVQLNRTADLQNKAVSVLLKLNPGKDFTTDIKYKTRSTATGTDTIPMLSLNISIADIFATGPSWGTAYFGTFSIKKVQLLYQIAGMPLNFWSTANGITDDKQRNALSSYYAAFLSRYLQDQALAGHPVYEADGVTLMRMGTAYQ